MIFSEPHYALSQHTRNTCIHYYVYIKNNKDLMQKILHITVPITVE